jgi:hypothetical protein
MDYINLSHIHECGNWERGCAVSFLGIHKPDLFAVYCPTTSPLFSFPFAQVGEAESIIEILLRRIGTSYFRGWQFYVERL